MPGMGKSQLVLQFAKLSSDRQQYSSIFWISGATVEKLNQGFAKVLHLIGHPDRDHPNQSTRLTSARRWLEESDTNGSINWLLILDNIAQEVVGFLRQHLPRKNSTGNILLTTRTRAVAEAAVTVAGQQHQVSELRAPELRDAANQFLKEAGIDASTIVPNSTNGAEALVKCVGRLPLAISHAASFAKHFHKNLDDVLGLYQSRDKRELINWEDDLSTYEQKSVAITFANQLEELERRSPDYSNFLKVLSFFDPESIPLSMIVEGAGDLRLQPAPHAPGTISLGGHTDNPNNTSFVSPKLESLIALIQSPVQLQRAIQQLHRLSLVGYKSVVDTSCLRIHDLIQITIQESAKKDTQHHWFCVAAALACGAFRHIDNPESYERWAQCEALSPHIQSLTKWDDEHLIGFPDLGQANIEVTHYLRSRGRYGEAETMLARVLAANEQLLGSGHQDTLQVANELAIIYRQQGRYKEAETLYEGVLPGRDRLLGPEHPDTLSTINNLAVVYALQGRYNEAEVLYGRALAGREKHFGSEHLETLKTVENLAIVYRYMAQYNEAEMLHRWTVAGRGKLLGFEHPDTLRSLENLAIIYQCQGRYEEAKTLYGRTLTCNENLLGSEHPQTLRTIGNLANIYQQEGKPNEAEILYERILVDGEKLLGSEHPVTLQTVNNLALAYQSQRRYKEAEALYKRALDNNERLLGPEHPNTLRTVGNLAITLFSQGLFNDAEKLYGRALAGKEKVLGPKHPNTLQTVQNFADFFKKQGRREDLNLLQTRFPSAFT